MLRLTRTFRLFLLAITTAILIFGCRTSPTPVVEEVVQLTALDEYVYAPDPAFKYEIVDTLPGDGFSTYVVRMVSQTWLTTAEVDRPEWWHWLSIVVPDGSTSETALLYIGGGSHRSKQPDENNGMFVQAAMAAKSPVGYLHNVPNQPLVFVNDTFGPRVEDEIISLGWRKYLEGGAKESDNHWLARFPMTKAAVRALDIMTAVSKDVGVKEVSKFVVAGGSKRGWTTWTTGAVDKRVVAIAPIVIDMLNVVPSFEHHWQAYGEWAPAVEDYEREGIMEWQGSEEYAKLLALTEPYSYRERLTIPKLIINASGDQFFLPDSWQFYWKDLKGEKHLRYVPNADHSLDGSDALESLTSFFQQVAMDKTRPDFDWKVENGKILLHVKPGTEPPRIKLWKAHNPDGRDFRVETIGKVWTSEDISFREDGNYELSVASPEGGYTAFFAELTYEDENVLPLKMTTGIVVTPDTYPHEPFKANPPRGTMP